MDIEEVRKNLVGNLGEDADRQKAKKEHIYMPLFFERLFSYDNAAFYYKLADVPLQFVIVIGAVIVPFLLSNPSVPKGFPFTVSIIVAIAAALTNHFKYGEHARICTMTCDAMKRERLAYELKRKPYSELSLEEAFEHFVDRVEEILREHSQGSIHIEEPKKAN